MVSRSFDIKRSVVRIHTHARHRNAPHIATARKAARGLWVALPKKCARLGPLMKGQKNAMPMTINARCVKGVAPMVVVGWRSVRESKNILLTFVLVHALSHKVCDDR